MHAEDLSYLYFFCCFELQGKSPIQKIKTLTSVLEVEIWSQMVNLRTAEIFKVVLRYAVRHGQVRSHVRLNRNLLMNLPL